MVRVVSVVVKGLVPIRRGSQQSQSKNRQRQDHRDNAAVRLAQELGDGRFHAERLSSTSSEEVRKR